MTNAANKDFRNAEITDFNNGFEMITYPAFTYLASTDDEANPITVDKGGRHLGQATPGIAVAFETRNHGTMFKHFGLGVYDKDDSWGNKAGEVYAYGKGASLTSDPRAHETLAAAYLGQKVRFNGKFYLIERASNDNITLTEV